MGSMLQNLSENITLDYGIIILKICLINGPYPTSCFFAIWISCPTFLERRRSLFFTNTLNYIIQLSNLVTELWILSLLLIRTVIRQSRL